jgi:hypothetical protein
VPILNIQKLGWGAVREKLKTEGGDTILIPVGSCERHGNPYTPLGLDGMVTKSVVERATRQADVLHTPVMPLLAAWVLWYEYEQESLPRVAGFPLGCQGNSGQPPGWFFSFNRIAR